LPYATPAFVKRLRRYQVQVRRSFSEGGSVVRLRAVVHSRKNRPANTLHADAAASTASHPASVTTRDPPLMRDETAELIVLIWGDREGNCFFGRDWTGQITLIWLGKLAFWSNEPMQTEAVTSRPPWPDTRFIAPVFWLTKGLRCRLVCGSLSTLMPILLRCNVGFTAPFCVDRTLIGCASPYPAAKLRISLMA
jgi:hypothetical protein